MTQLPIHELLAPLRKALVEQNQVILQAPTGSGKSTALPLAMLDWPEIQGRIILLEPRRVAARNIAHYLAKCRQQNVGEEVGYRVRGETQVSRKTRLEIVTEGVLTRMIQADPELSDVAVVIFDEIHERHLTTDLGLALALEVQGSLREDLKLVAMSATLQGLGLHDLMPHAASLQSQGRSFPVGVIYRAPRQYKDWLSHCERQIIELLDSTSELAQSAVAAVVALNPQSDVQTLQQGSILVFLPGQKEINQLARRLGDRFDEAVDICPLYGSLSFKAQDRALSMPSAKQRKVVLATNIAESSLTIAGVTFVVDCGLVRQASFNPKTGVTLLETKRISQASAVQRSGRAGRITEGACLRLWSKEEQGRLVQSAAPEILTSELVSMALDGAFWGVRSFSELALLTPPAPVNEQLAWELLQSLKMIDAQHKLTAHGRTAYTLGCHPRLAHMLLTAQAIPEKGQEQQRLLALACLLATLVEARGLPKLGVDISQYLTLACQAPLLLQAKKWLQKSIGVAQAKAIDFNRVAREATDTDIGMLLALAYPDRIAKQRGLHGYQLANGTGVELYERDALANQPWLVVADFQQQQGQSAGQVFLASRLEPALFEHELAELMQSHNTVGWDKSTGKFVAERQQKVGRIIVTKQKIASPSREALNQAILELVAEQGLQLLNMHADVEQLRYRVMLGRQVMPHMPWPDLSEKGLLDTLASWLLPYLDTVTSLKQLQQLNHAQILHNLMAWDCQQELASLVPTHWTLTTGTRSKITYQNDGRALMRVKLQETFGLQQSPVVAKGAVIVTLELLSPAQRPLALTSDLASFWQGPYVEVKKEMRGRYPKHLWPDDPANTQPTKFTKKRTLAGDKS